MSVSSQPENRKASKPLHSTSPGELQLVSFHLGSEEFCLDILRVQEIIRLPQLTRVPNSPYAMDGVMNLRGKIIPVIALRKAFALDRLAHDKQSRIVVIETNGSQFGFIVDSVSEVLRIPADTVAPPPQIGRRRQDYVSGIGKFENRLLILLDIERLLTTDGMLGGAAPPA